MSRRVLRCKANKKKEKTTEGKSALEYHHVLVVGRLCMRHNCPHWMSKLIVPRAICVNEWVQNNHFFPRTSVEASMNGTIKIHVKQLFSIPMRGRPWAKVWNGLYTCSLVEPTTQLVNYLNGLMEIKPSLLLDIFYLCDY